MRLLVLLVLVAATLAPSAPAAAEEETILLVRIENTYEAADATIRVDDEAQRVVFSRDVRAERGMTEIEVGVEPGHYVVYLMSRDPGGGPLADVFGNAGFVSQGVAAIGCPGPTAVDFDITVQGMATRGDGCTVLSEHAAALLAEARAAKASLARTGFSVPAPGSGDRGVYGGALFEWRGDVAFLDAWGRPVHGPEVRYVAHGGSRYEAGGFMGPAATAEVGDTVEVLRYLEGETTPHAWSRTGAGFGTSDSATASSVTIERELRYDAPWRTLPCGLRNGLQGRTIRAGDEIASADLCPSWTGPAWRAAAPLTIEGYRLLPLYQLEESPERILIGRVYLLDGIAYPFALERHVLPAGGFLSSAGIMLERYEGAGAPIALSPRPWQEPSSVVEPLDPLRGPATGAAGGRLELTLSDAADAALADPTLGGLAAVLAEPDAALIGASFGISRDEGSPLAMLQWLLVYSASDAPPVHLLCERPQAQVASPIPVPTAAPVRCRDRFPMTGLVDPLTAAPSMGRDALPANAASFAQAIERWDAIRDAADAEPVTFAVYRAWADEREAMLAVGAGVAMPLTPADSDVGGSADHVALELATGRTLASVQVVQAGVTLGDAPLGTVGPTTLRVDVAPFLESDALPLIVGSGIGLALLALLGFLLYSRLVRARVLDSATRAAILDVVTSEPGLHASGIMERLGKRGGVTEYHLDVLVREGFLTSLATPGFRRYFATGSRTPHEMRAIAAMREGQNEKLLRIIRANPGIRLQTLAMEAGVSVPYASRSIARLAEAGLVEKVQVGRAVTLHAAEA